MVTSENESCSKIIFISFYSMRCIAKWNIIRRSEIRKSERCLFICLLVLAVENCVSCLWTFSHVFCCMMLIPDVLFRSTTYSVMSLDGSALWRERDDQVCSKLWKMIACCFSSCIPLCLRNATIYSILTIKNGYNKFLYHFFVVVAIF